MPADDPVRRVGELAGILEDVGSRLPGIHAEDLAERVLHALTNNSNATAALQSLRDSFANPAFQSSHELDTVWKALEWGGMQFDLFPRFMYHNYEKWKAVAESYPYNKLHRALAEADAAIAPEAARLIAQRGISEVYSMGPSPKIDKVLLEEIVKASGKVTYCPVDVNTDAVKATLDEVTAHLSSVFGSELWGQHVSFGDCKATNFDKVKSRGTACVVYTSGTVMNDRMFWQQAARIAQKGGIVVASAALNPDESDYSSYWLDFYDKPEGKAMFESALRKSLPDLFSSKNMDKWSIGFEYVPNPNRATAYWADYHTPRISVQLRVKEPMTVSVDGSPIHLLPTRTWKEVDEWEDWRSWFRQRFDNDERIAAAIKEAYDSNDFSLLPEECKKGNPIELVTSAKLVWPYFLEILPKEFGLSRIGFVTRGIDYVREGKQGLAMAAVFRVEEPNKFMPGLKDMGMPRWFPPQYAHDPAYLTWLANIQQTLPRK